MSFALSTERNLLPKRGLQAPLKTQFLSNQTEDFTIQAMEVDKDHIHLLVDYSPNVSVAQIVRLLKQMTTSAVWFSHSDELRKHFWKQKVFWSSGYFVCSTGDASTETIAKYIAEQG